MGEPTLDPVDVLKSINEDLRARVAALEAACAAKDAALREVEWGPPGHAERSCSRCLHVSTLGHRDDCPVRAALALTPAAAGERLRALEECADILTGILDKERVTVGDYQLGREALARLDALNPAQPAAEPDHA